MTSPTITMNQPTDSRLGYKHAEDPRDKLHPFAAVLPSPQLFGMLPENRYWPMFRKVLDQGYEGTCVGHGIKHFMMAAPIIQTTPTKHPTAINIYDEAIVIDEWTDNDNDAADGQRTFGTSVRAGLKVLQKYGFIQEYLWSNNPEEVYAFLRGFGSVVIGVPWFTGMFRPKADGLIHPTGQIEGGHCVAVNYINLKKKLVGGPNSWGPGWGLNGNWRMPIEEFDSIIQHSWSEIACAVEVRVTPARVAA